MSACERCWRDSRYADNYIEVLTSRREKPCTPEEQAGPGAGLCLICDRRTLHQYTNEPMCGCKE